MELKIESLELADPAFQPIVERIATAIQEANQVSTKRQELPRYMTKAQASEYIGCSFNTFQKFVRAGLPLITVDGIVRVDQKDVDDFLAQNKK